MSPLNLRSISVDGPERALLKAVSLTVGAGEIHAVIGPNGAGKSTLLKAVSGEIRLAQGSVILGGSAPQRPQERARRLAVLPQFSRLHFPFSTREVVALGRTPHRSGHRIDADIVDAAMELMDIHALAQRLYPQLSGGEKQRTQLARVLAQIWRAEDGEPRLLLLDEPTSGLDLGHQQQLMAAIKTFAQQGVGVLMVVHDINLAAAHADYCLALAAGECVAQGPIAEVFSLPLLNRLFKANLQLSRHPDNQQPYVFS